MDQHKSGVKRATSTRRSVAWGVAIAVATMGIVWLMLTAVEVDSRRQFFGLWRVRHLGIGVAAIFLSILVFAYGLSKRVLFSLVLATLMVLITLSLIELIGAVGLVSYPIVFGREGEVLGKRAVPHLDVEGETLGDLAHRWRYSTDLIPFHYVTDRHGFRNDEDRSDADIYLVGDSIIVAGLVPFQSTLTFLLEQELKVRTMNVALIGLSPQQERDLFKSLRPPTDGRLVLQFVFEGNDLLDSRRYEASGSRNAKSTIESTFSYGLLMMMQDLSDRRKLAHERRIGRIGDTDYLFGYVADSFQDVEDQFGPIGEALLDMSGTVESSGGTYALVYVPAKIRVLGSFCRFPAESSIQDYRPHLSPFREWMSDWCQQQGIPLLDITDPLIESAKAGAIPWFPADTHLNAIGHRVAANAIKRWRPVVSWKQSK